MKFIRCQTKDRYNKNEQIILENEQGNSVVITVYANDGLDIKYGVSSISELTDIISVILKNKKEIETQLERSIDRLL